MAEKLGGPRRLPRARRPSRGGGRRRRARSSSSTLTERQAQAILDMRLGRLTGLEREKLEAEYKRAVGAHRLPRGPARRREEADGRDHRRAQGRSATEFADERRTEIVDAEGEILTEELIDEEEMVVTRTHLGYIKRTPRARVPGAGARRPRHHRRGERPTGTSSPTCSSRRRTTTCCCSPTRAASTTRRCSSCPRARAPRRAARSSTCSSCRTASRSSRCCRSRSSARTRACSSRRRRGTVKKTELDAVREHPRRAASRRSRSTTATASSAPR